MGLQNLEKQYHFEYYQHKFLSQFHFSPVRMGLLRAAILKGKAVVAQLARIFVCLFKQFFCGDNLPNLSISIDVFIRQCIELRN